MKIAMTALVLGIALIGCRPSYPSNTMEYSRDVPLPGARCVNKLKWTDCATGKTVSEVRGGSGSD